MKRIAIAIGAIALMAGGIAAAGLASEATDGLTVSTITTTAPPPDKVFVCKYVGTPDVDERLQTGDNPISVSSSSTGGTAVGSFFADAQGRSFVLAIDNGQPEPPASDCPVPDNPTPHLFSADTVCNPTSGEFDVTGRVDGLLALVSLLHIAGNVSGDTQVTVTLGDLVGTVTVHTTGDCTMAPPPPPPPPPTQVTGTATVICDLGAQLYRLFGTIDGQAADLVTPPTFPGTTKGVQQVVVRRGDTSFRTTVTLNGDCAPPTTVTPPPVTVVVPLAPPVAAKPPAAKPPVKPKPVVKPKPKPKPKHHAKPRPRKPTVHICKPLKDGTLRIWVPKKGCMSTGGEPSHLTG